MNKSLRFVSISHKNALVSQREVYQIPEENKKHFIELVCKTFSDITGLLLLATCNRTELYFESETTKAIDVRNFLINLKAAKKFEVHSVLFQFSDATKDTVKHLLLVSSGLASSILGDVEIIHQIKKAYQLSISINLQGSMLERATQAVFKTHKRISNETHFRDGTTSVAYKALKVVFKSFNHLQSKEKNILFIGAGDIVKQLFKYNSKFNFKNIHISNRTEVKAQYLAIKNCCKVFNWDKVVANDFNGLDIIVSATSNCHHLIKHVPQTTKKMVLIDLAIPSNIDKTLAAHNNITFYDLDTISIELESNKEKRLAAVIDVNKIIDEELSLYHQWLQEAPLRELLSQYKITINKKVSGYLGPNTEKSKINMVTNQVLRKLMAQPKTLSSQDIDSIISEKLAQ